MRGIIVIMILTVSRLLLLLILLISAQSVQASLVVEPSGGTTFTAQVCDTPPVVKDGDLISGTSCRSVTLSVQDDGSKKVADSSGYVYESVCAEIAGETSGLGVSSLRKCAYIATGDRVVAKSTDAETTKDTPHTTSAEATSDPSTSGVSGLVVACREGEEGCVNPYAPENYGPCELVSTLSNVLRFLVTIAGIIAVIVVVYVGFLYVTSQGNPTKIAKGKGMFMDVVIGFVIALSAYLIVNTIMAVLVGDDSSLMKWDTVECVYEGGVTKPSYVLDVERHPVDVILDSGDGDDSVSGSAGGDLLFDDSILSGAGVCSGDLLSPIFGSDAAAAACIARAESGCGGSFYSKSDIDSTGTPFSVSPWQINLTVHEVVGCGSTLDCKSAYSGRNYKAKIINKPLYDACVTALSNPKCAATNARRIQQTSGWRAWSTASKCGL